MNRKDADERIAQILSGVVPIERSQHFTDMMCQRGYGMQDVYAILRVHESQTPPVWDAEHGNFVVELIGNDLDGRRTQLVIGLHPQTPCVGISVMLARRRVGRRK
jgi:hypothetical protein